MIWISFVIAGMIFFTVVTAHLYRNYKKRTGGYPPEILWIVMTVLGSSFIISFYLLDRIERRTSFIILGLYIGAMISVRVLIGKESERDVKKDMTTDEDIDWRESPYDYKPGDED